MSRRRVLVPYTPEWVAACYGVKVNEPCPSVDLFADIEDAQAMKAWEDATLLERQRRWLASIEVAFAEFDVEDRGVIRSAAAEPYEFDLTRRSS